MVRPPKQAASAHHPHPSASGQPRGKVAVSFQFVKEGDSFCLSDCEQKGVRGAVQSLRIVCSLTWEELLRTGANKNGVNCRPYDWDVIKRATRPQSLTEDVKLFRIKAGEKARIFAVRVDDLFCPLWFDEDHQIVPD